MTVQCAPRAETSAVRAVRPEMRSWMPALAAMGLLGCMPTGRTAAPEQTTPPTPCTSPDECAEGKGCVDGFCGACTAATECASGEQCRAGTCHVPVTCQSDLQCKDLDEVCDVASGSCVPCNAATDCDAGKACLSKTCVAVKACQSSRECAASEVCATAVPPLYPASVAGHACAQCASAGDCPAGNACRDGRCVDVCAGRKCGTQQGIVCGACPGSGACVGDGRMCLVSMGSVPVQPDSMLGVGTSVYVTERDSYSTVYRVPRTGSPVRVGQYGGYVNNLATNGTNVYWFVASGGTSSVYASTAGSSSAHVVWSTTVSNCYVIAADGQAIYCHSNDDGDWFGVYRIPLSGVTATPVKLTDPNRNIDFNALLPAGDRLYLGSGNNSFAAWVPTAGGAMRTLSTKQVSGETMALDAVNLYFSGYDDVFAVPVSGGQTRSLLHATSAAIAGVDGQTLYVAADGELLGIDTATGARRTVVARSELQVARVSMSGRTIYILGAPDMRLFALDLP